MNALLCATLVLIIGAAARQRIIRPDARTLQVSHDDSSRSRRPLPHHSIALTAMLGVALIAGWLAAVTLVMGRLAWPRVRTIIDARQRRAAVVDSVPDAVELLILIIRSGLTPHQAIAAMTTQAPIAIRPGFEEVTRRIRRGEGLADALAGLPAVLGPSLLVVADTLAIAERHGTPIGDALTQLSVDVRDQRRRAREADARKLPVRLSFPLVFCTLPSFVLVAIAPAVLAALSSLGDTTW